MRNIIFFVLFITLSNCSPKIKTITQYEQQNEALIKRNRTEFDRKGNKIKEVNYGQSYDQVKIVIYENNLKKSETQSFCYPNDKCYVETFSTFSYDKDKNIEKQIMYVKDSLIWQIKEEKKGEGFVTIKSYNWDIEATKKPDFEQAFIILDTLFYDKKNRLIKQTSYSKTHAKPFIDLYTYNENGYRYEIKETAIDTVYDYKYSKEQKNIVKYLPQYQFYNPKERIYKIEYY